MKRNCTLKDISDGRLYRANDLVRADSRGCAGCSQCCRGMGASVILDPYDVYRLRTEAGYGLERLLGEGRAELNVVDGVILPNLRMAGAEECCTFLDGQGRCGIHKSRPGICRIFPLGRYYENGDFSYFLQAGQCREANCAKVKVSKWIDTPRQRENHAFLCSWHYFLNELEERLSEADDEERKQLNLQLLYTFYFVEDIGEQDFYVWFEEGLQQLRRRLQ